MFKRSSGILMHISSLPGKYGIGDFGKSAYDFVDFLEKSNQKLWQILPLGATGYGDSPYQSFSAFAGNPYFIDLDQLVKDGYLREEDLEPLKKENIDGTIDYEKLYKMRYEVLEKAYDTFLQKGNVEKVQKFRNKNLNWIEDYALYMALKKKFNGISWLEWPKEFRDRQKNTIKESKIKLQESMTYYIFLEFLFREHWLKLKNYANKKGIKIIGDIPIFVATDSADTWTNTQMFQFDKKKNPKRVAGCPPDAFSKDGQLWGNILYNWKVMEEDKFDWWIKRIKTCFNLYDIVRIDHFRGFESYWSIPAKSKTAASGKWEKGPGIKLFNEIKRKLGVLPIIAEDLGFLTPKVHKLLKDSGYPGMKILEFAFDSREESDYLPHKYPYNSVAYTGTHDNLTVVGWYETVNETDRNFCDEYLSKFLKEIGGDIQESINWKFIEATWGSKSKMALAQMQDFLGLGIDARMNTPSTLGNNWTWRMKSNSLTEELAKKIENVTVKFKR